MDRINTATKVVDLFGAGKHGWQNSNLGLGQLATEFNADWCNGLQEEIANVIEGAGLVLDGLVYTQLLQAIQLLTAAPGAVVCFARNTAPTGYLKANGALVSRVAYAALFTAIGTTFGVGDGATTFALPDLRGEFIRGWDDARGVDSGRVFGSAQAEDLAAHSHAIPGAIPNGNGGAFDTVPTSGGLALKSSSTTSSAGGTETRPRNIALLACIKY